MRRHRRRGVVFGEGVSPPQQGWDLGRRHCPSPEIFLILCLEMVQFWEDLCIQVAVLRLNSGREHVENKLQPKTQMAVNARK